VALFGTQGLTEARLGLLKRSKVKKINLIFDTDQNQSGQRAVLEVGERLFRSGFQTSIVALPLPDGQIKTDLNSYFQDHSLDEFKALPLKDFFEHLLEFVPNNGTPQSRYKSLQPILELVSGPAGIDLGGLRETYT